MLSIKRREKKKYIRVLRKRKKKNIKVFVVVHNIVWRSCMIESWNR